MRAKMVVSSVEDFGETVSVKACAVTTGSKENKSFWKWTPAANLELHTVNKEAAAEFKPGQEFYLDFTPVD